MTEIQPKHLDTIQDLLYRLLAPVGTYRRQLKPSKGRRWKKLQHRKAAKSESCARGEAAAQDAQASVEPEPEPEPRPEVLPYLTVGFNSTMRCLESLCHESMPDTIRRFLGEKADSDTTKSKRKRKSKSNTRKKTGRLVAVFVCRSSLSPAHYAYIPQLVELASKDRAPGQEIRLIPLSRGAEGRLAKAMGLPRVGIVGLTDCKPASVLIDYVKENLP